jgi:hypothetical protein
MNPPAESGEHLGGMGEVAGLAKDLSIQHDDGVGTQNQISGRDGRHGERLHLRIRKDKVAG